MRIDFVFQDIDELCFMTQLPFLCLGFTVTIMIRITQPRVIPIAILIVLGLVGVVDGDSPNTSKWYNGENGREYRFFSSIKHSEGYSKCNDIGGTFAFVNSEDELDIIADLLQDENGASVDLVWDSDDERFEKRDGTALSPSDPKPSEPRYWWFPWCYRVTSDGDFRTTDCSSDRWAVCERAKGANYVLVTRGVFKYSIWTNDEQSWRNARDACRNWESNAELATIDSQAEHNFLRQYVTARTWIGLNDYNNDRTFEWVDGSPFTRTSRKSDGLGPTLNLMGEKDDLSKGDCIAMQDSSDWRDDKCSNSENFVCRVQVEDCLPSTYRSYATNECTDCPPNQFTDSKNQVGCESFSACDSNEIEVAAPTPSSDRKCQVCQPGTFLQTGTGGVQVCTDCTLGVDFQSQSGRTSCDAVRTCNEGTFISKSATRSSDTMICRMIKRGLLIVLEGTDRCGKSTQCARLVSRLNEEGTPAKLMRFPERSTAIGGIIDQYLKKQVELHDRAAHLLFSANRWELIPEIMANLEAGTTLVIDRYSFSGVAFTSAKEGLDLEWCKQPEVGLPAPDLLIHMQIDAQEAEQRGGFGEERYEVSEFQQAVKQKYAEMYAALEAVKPTIVDVSGKSIEEVEQLLKTIVDPVIKGERKELGTLW
eukprot:m.228778 g.228778  ORF g.228778 m.228778 type:complete len:649 (+) comp15194_c0_seq2:65-2011(+)